MMGRLNRSQGRLFYSFCLEETIPDDHLVRKVAAVLDLSWVHAELAPHYPDNGRPISRRTRRPTTTAGPARTPSGRVRAKLSVCGSASKNCKPQAPLEMKVAGLESEVEEAKAAAKPPPGSKPASRCSICHEKKQAVLRPGFICDDCV